MSHCSEGHHRLRSLHWACLAACLTLCRVGRNAAWCPWWGPWGLQLYLVILVGGHRDEGSLWEHMGAEGCVFGAKSIVLISLHDV